MAKKTIPLKDEQMYSVDDVYTKLVEIVDVFNQLSMRLAQIPSHHQEQITHKCTIDSESVKKNVIEAMRIFLKDNHDQIVVNMEQSVSNETQKVLNPYLKSIQVYCQDLTKLHNMNTLLVETLNEFTERLKPEPSNVTKPVKPQSWKKIPCYWFFILPWYHIRSFFTSSYFKKWGLIVLICSCVTSIFTMLFILKDNARLEDYHEKYILLREAARSDEEWSAEADFIDFIYTDKEEHRKGINWLWEKRRRRLNQLKTCEKE